MHRASPTPQSKDTLEHYVPRWVAPVAIVVSVTVLSVRLFHFIDRYAVNTLFWDHSWWELFTWQHGPHRQGLGFLVIKLTAMASDWDTRTEGFVIAGIFLASTALALAIEWRLTRRWSLADVAIPPIVLTLTDYEAFIGATNPAHGPLPVFLVLATVLVRFIARPWPRVVLTLLLNFLVVYTGFGLVFGPVILTLFLVDLGGAVRRRQGWALQAIGLVGSAAILVAFFSWHYVVAPAVDCFVFPDPHPLRYVTFIAAMYLRAFELDNVEHLRSLFAVLIVAANLTALSWGAWGTLKTAGESRPHSIVFALCGFTLLFSANAAIGRVCLADGGGGSQPRYVPYVLPSLLGCYYALQTARLRSTMRVSLLAFFLAACVAREARTYLDGSSVRWYSDGKRHWVDCYLKKQDVAVCDREAGFKVYPDAAATHLDRKLAFLREHHVNLYKGAR